MKRALVLFAALGCSPAEPPKVAIKPPAPVAKPEPARAKWVLGRAIGWELGRALDLGGGSSLIIGAEGQRWIKKGAELTHAETLLPEDLVAAFHGPRDTIEIIGASGTVYLTQGPLGRPVSVKPANLEHATASPRAIVGIRDGRVVRSTDRAVSFQELSLDAGDPVDVVLDRTGHGLLLMLPERLYETDDHGATWHKLKLPNVEAERVSIADDGAVYLGTKESGHETDDHWIEAAPPLPIAAVATRGKFAVAVAHKRNQAPHVAVTTLGGKRMFQPVPGLDKCTLVSAAIAADHVAVACATRNPDDRLLVARSFDAGKTWRVSKGYPFADARFITHIPFAIGPKGRLLFTERDHIALVNSETAEPITVGAAGLELNAAILDEKRILFTATADDKHALYEATLDGDKVTKKFELGPQPVGSVQLAVDKSVTYVTNAQEKVLLVSRIEDAVTRKQLPLENARVSLASARGLVAAGGRLYETTDGGDHLRDVGRAPEGPIACSDDGCSFASASRIGWDEASAVSLAAVPIPPPPPPAVENHPVVACTRTGKPIKSSPRDLVPAQHLGATSFRVPTANGYLVGTFEKPVVESKTLFKATPQKNHIVFHSLDDGFVAMRYVVAPKIGGISGTRSVSLEMSFQRAGEKSLHTASAGTIGTFRISPDLVEEGDRWYWVAGLVDGGAIVRPAYPRADALQTKMTSVPIDEDDPRFELHVPRDEGGKLPFYFASDAGKIQKIEGPKGVLESSILYRAGDRWFAVARRTTNGTLAVYVSTDAKGTTWQRRNVRLTRERPDAIQLATVNGRPTFTIIPKGSKRGYVTTLSLDGSRELDVRAFDVPPLDRAHACKKGDPLGLRVAVEVPWPTRPSTNDGVQLTDWVLSVPGSGPVCVAVLGGFYGNKGWLIPMSDPASSVGFEPDAVQSASCVLP